MDKLLKTLYRIININNCQCGSNICVCGGNDWR